jgi:hypothetical protein
MRWDKHSSTINSDSSHYLARAFNNSFLNIQLKISTTQEIESIIKSLKPKNTCEYDEISTKLLKISSAYINSPLKSYMKYIPFIRGLSSTPKILYSKTVI